MEFVKHDTGKPMLSLIEPDYVFGIAEVLTMGANKYSKGNWKNCEDTDRYKDAMLRHMYQYLNGEKNDTESGLSHLYHISCNAMFLDYFDRKGKDD